MKTLTKVVLGAGALAVVAGGVAIADGRGYGPRWGEGHGHGMGRGAGIERAFDRFDTDHDGIVALEEVLARPGARFADADTTQDGFVDKAEIEAAIVKRRQAMIEQMIKRLDVDGDGKISKEESEKPIKKRFALFDKNDDGKVTKDEARDAMPMFGGGRHGGPGGPDGPGGWHRGPGGRGPMGMDGPGAPPAPKP